MASWIEDLLHKNPYTRPGYKLLDVKALVMHWTANPGAGDENHQKYFDGSAVTGKRYASAHIFVDRDSATLIVPLNEVAYHANDMACKIDRLKASASYYKGGNANLTTIGLEMCVEKDGTIHTDTIKRSIKIAALLMKQFKLDAQKDIYRHYDITGKNCPAPWVSKPALFKDFKNNVEKEMGIKQATVTKPAPKKVEEIKLAKVLVDSLYTYNSPDWNDKGVTVNKDEVFTIVRELTVKGSKMLLLKSGLYMTANPKYVKIYTK